MLFLVQALVDQLDLIVRRCLLLLRLSPIRLGLLDVDRLDTKDGSFWCIAEVLLLITLWCGHFFITLHQIDFIVSHE